MVIVPIGQQTFRRSIPPGGNILCIGLLGENSLTTAKIGQLDLIIKNQNILRLDIPMKYPIPMHMINCLQQLIDNKLAQLTIQILLPSPDKLIHVAFHQLEHQS